MDGARWKKVGGGVGLVASGVIVGGVLAGTLTANAADERSGPSTNESRNEELLTGDTKTQVEDAVLAEYPDATIQHTETDSGGVYESHIVTADGEELTVLVDEDFAVTGTESGGHGEGGHGGRHGGSHAGDRDGDADGDPAQD